MAFDYATNNGFSVWSLNGLPQALAGKQNILGISCRFPHIMSKNIIGLFDRGILNMHGGELPRFRGVNIPNHLIIEGVSEGAGTIHYIDEGVDTGPIIDRMYFPIRETDTAYDVFIKTQNALMQVFDRSIERILSGDANVILQQTLIDGGEIARTYRAADLEALRCMPEDINKEQLLKYARAFSFPGHEPAYWVVNGQKLYVTVKRND